VRIDELKTAKEQRPFHPFSIRIADGREIQVRHPDAVACDADRPRIAICTVPGGDWEVIDAAQVTSLGMLAPAPASGATRFEGNLP
jgi:hypothetical protein